MWEIIGSIVIFIFGLLFFKPELIWKIKHSWDVKDGEPTDGYIIFFKCVGIFAIVLGIILFIVYNSKIKVAKQHKKYHAEYKFI